MHKSTPLKNGVLVSLGGVPCWFFLFSFFFPSLRAISEAISRNVGCVSRGALFFARLLRRGLLAMTGRGNAMTGGRDAMTGITSAP